MNLPKLLSFGDSADESSANNTLLSASSLKGLLELDVHCFWHQEDHYTITSRGMIISYPGYASGQGVICMKPELCSMDTIMDCDAICSDYVHLYKSNNKPTNDGASFSDTR